MWYAADFQPIQIKLKWQFKSNIRQSMVVASFGFVFHRWPNDSFNVRSEPKRRARERERETDKTNDEKYRNFIWNLFVALILIVISNILLFLFIFVACDRDNWKRPECIDWRFTLLIVRRPCRRAKKNVIHRCDESFLFISQSVSPHTNRSRKRHEETKKSCAGGLECQNICVQAYAFTRKVEETNILVLARSHGTQDSIFETIY